LAGGEMVRGQGSLRVLDSRVEESPAPRGRIIFLRFEVELAFPMDLQAAVTGELLRAQGRENAAQLRDDCGGAEPVATVRQSYADLDGDGVNEGIILARSCFSGTGGADLFFVFKRSPSGSPEAVPVATPNPSDTGGLRGLMDYRVEEDVTRFTARNRPELRLVQVFPVFLDSDPQCCPAGGTRRFLYRWQDGRLVVERTENVARQP
jgi:hypothetical protein